MNDPENSAQSLMRTPSQQTMDTAAGRSSRAFKVAGITLLAGVLIVGQVVIAYVLISQQSDIKSLEKQNNKLEVDLKNGNSVSVPARMQVPMNVMSVMDVSEEASVGAQEKSLPQTTSCLEAAGVKLQVPGFQPLCDESGLYKAQQCFEQRCWCVDRVTGEEIPGSLTDGAARCTVPAGKLMARLHVAD